MENVWEKLKLLKGRSWIETKDILNKIGKDIPQVEEIVVSYNVNSETLPPEEREIYGVYPKSEPFYLKRCKLCSHLLKPCVLNHHYDIQHKRNINSAKKTSFVSPGKKKHGKKGNKSTSEDDSESVISSEAPSPAVDLQESQSNDSNTGTIRDDSIIDVISVDEIPSEESKPPTPGPQDFYEEFAVPYSEEVQVILSAENGESSKPSYSNSKPVLKLKINSSKDSNPKQSSSTTSLLEAHLLSNTKYSTSGSGGGNCGSDVKYRGLNYKFGSATFKNDGPSGDQSARKSEEAAAVAEPNEWKASMSVGSPKLKTETKISIPISVVPQTVKIIGSLKKPNSQVAAAPSPVSSLEESCGVPASPYQIEPDPDAATEVPAPNGVKEKSTKSKRSKRSKGKNRSAKTTEFDPDKHCGVLLDENRHCLRSLTCKTHAIALRRAVEGRSKEFDKLLADHRASKEAGKEHERYPSVALSEPSHSIPISSSEKAIGVPAPSQAANSDAEIIKIRVPNVSSSAAEVSPAVSNFENSPDRSPSPKVEPAETASPKIPYSLKTAVTGGPKPVNVVSKVPQNASSMNGEVKPQIYDSDIKISFVYSDMLYKVGGLLYTDRSRQAIRKCMEPLVSPARLKAKRGPLNRQRITDFLRQVKSHGAQPVQRLRLFKEDAPYPGKPSGAGHRVAALRDQLAQKAHDEVERMKQVLSSSTRALNGLAADEHEMRRFRACAKRKSDRLAVGAKKAKQEALVADENYDLNSLLCIGAKGEPAARFQEAYVKPEQRTDYEYDGSGAGYVDTAQLLQTYKDLEHEIRSTVGPGMQELYPAPQPYVYAEAPPYKCADGDYKAQMEDHIEETISKNYSLLEEYCKNIPTDELFLEPKPPAQYYESDGAKKSEPNGAVYRAEVAAGEGLFDAQLLNTYLSSIADGHGAAEMGYDAGRQFEVAPEQAMSKEQVYGEMLTLNKQFQDRAAVNIEKPPAPNPVVYTEVENDEVLKWLF